MKANTSFDRLEEKRKCLYVDLYQTCTNLPLHSIETLCRKIHVIEVKLNSFRGGILY